MGLGLPERKVRVECATLHYAMLRYAARQEEATSEGSSRKQEKGKAMSETHTHMILQGTIAIFRLPTPMIKTVEVMRQNIPHLL